jgi:hypothetical protein
MSADQIRFGSFALNSLSSKSSATRTPGTRIVVLPRRFGISPEIRASRISRATRLVEILMPWAMRNSAWILGVP